MTMHRPVKIGKVKIGREANCLAPPSVFPCDNRHNLGNILHPIQIEIGVLHKGIKIAVNIRGRMIIIVGQALDNDLYLKTTVLYGR